MSISIVELAAQAEALATPVARASYLHGPHHWRAVARVGSVIAARSPGIDRRSLFLFAALHDTQRLNDGTDPEHGTRAALVLKSELEHGLDPGRLERLVYALRHHSGGTASPQHEDPTIGACWDSDRLTLDRVGIEPEPRYISTPAVRSDLERFRDLAIEFGEGDDVTWEEIAADYR